MTSQSQDERAVVAQTRFGWGVSPDGLDFYRSDPAGRLAAELSGDVDLSDLPGERGSSEALYRRVILQRASRETAPAELRAQSDAFRKRLRDDTIEDRVGFVARAIRTQAPFLDRLINFWADHFTVSTRKPFLQGVTAAYTREAIAPHVLGRFSDMLNAVVRHPAMLIYLDNRASIGPNSRAGQRRNLGLNENFAREVLELHTLGADGGYTQEDVVSFAEALTGWTFDMPQEPGEAAAFRFIANRHEPGDKIILGKRYPDEGEAQGAAVLADLAVHPKTAANVARKLALHFVSDDPPAELLADLSDVFMETGGDLRALSLAMIESEAAWSAPRQRFLPPQDFLIAVARAYPDILTPRYAANLATRMGQPVGRPPSPEGYEDGNGDWLGPEALKQRLELAREIGTKIGNANSAQYFAGLYGDVVSRETLQMLQRAETSAQGTVLAIMSPEFLRR